MDNKKMELLIDAFVLGDLYAFERIYELTNKFVYNVIFRMVKNEFEAEDLTQDIYIKVYENRASYKKQSDIKTWIYRIAFNNTLNHIKKQNRIFSFITELGRGVIFNDDYQEENDENDIKLVYEVLKRIKPEFRICIILKDIENKSYEEIALILEINIGTVRSRLNRGRQQFVKLYKREERLYDE
ncbi:RNA polymerase sigma factor [Candidatus Margulisiibacteriota bacterium]